MKLVSYRKDGEIHAGALFGANADRVLDVLGAQVFHELEEHRTASRASAEQLYGAGVLGFVTNAHKARPVVEALLDRASRGALPDHLHFPLAQADLVAPIPRPPSMRDGYAFRQHVEAARRNRGVPMIPEFDHFPVFYFTNHQAVVGPGELVVPKHARAKLDFELEAAIVVGKPGRDIPVEHADEHVFGFCIMNDWSARHEQMEEMKLNLGPAKGKDFATGLGPILVTRDELADVVRKTPKGEHHPLAMRAFVNGKQLSEGNLGDMHFTFAEILARASAGVTLYPGDVIGSGTVGTGCLLELNGSKITNDQWLQNGDVVVMEIDRLGRLENRVIFGP